VRLPRFSRLYFALLLLLVLAIAVILHGLWMPALGWALVHDDGPAKADAAVVLAGDFNGFRIMHAAELLKNGYVPKILVSGPLMLYGRYESDLAIDFAVEKGCRREWFEPLHHQALSTAEEAKAIYPELQRRGIQHFLLVTSNFHTARAARIFRAEAAAEKLSIDMRTVASPDRYFHLDSWWREREGQKIFFFETAKTVATAVGL